MRNLRVLGEKIGLLPFAGPFALHPCEPLVYGVRQEEGSSSSSSLFVFDFLRNKVVDEVPLVVEGSVVAVVYIQPTESVAVAVSNGDIIVYDLSTQEVEVVGTVEHGIETLSMSHDQEVVAIVSMKGSLITMSPSFDLLREVPLCAEEEGEAQPVNVGWGSEHSQFQGSAGKLSSRPRPGPAAPVPYDDQITRVSWRGDGEYFATLSIDAKYKEKQDGGEADGLFQQRVLRVWAKDCRLQGTNRDTPSLEQSLAWKPSGSLIAGTQRLPHRHDVVFFERNTLRHLEFTLTSFPPNSVYVEEMAWNSDSSILALVVQHMHTKASTVQLYITANYHWYLKQEFHFDAQGRGHVTRLQWAIENPSLLHISTSKHLLCSYTLSFDIDSSFGLSSRNLSMVAVIDGVLLLTTPFRLMVIPPPMSAHKIHLPSSSSSSFSSSTTTTSTTASPSSMPTSSHFSLNFASAVNSVSLPLSFGKENQIVGVIDSSNLFTMLSVSRSAHTVIGNLDLNSFAELSSNTHIRHFVLSPLSPTCYAILFVTSLTSPSSSSSSFSSSDDSTACPHAQLHFILLKISPSSPPTLSTSPSPTTTNTTSSTETNTTTPSTSTTSHPPPPSSSSSSSISSLTPTHHSTSFLQSDIMRIIPHSHTELFPDFLIIETQDGALYSISLKENGILPSVFPPSSSLSSPREDDADDASSLEGGYRSDMNIFASEENSTAPNSHSLLFAYQGEEKRKGNELVVLPFVVNEMADPPNRLPIAAPYLSVVAMGGYLPSSSSTPLHATPDHRPSSSSTLLHAPDHRPSSTPLHASHVVVALSSVNQLYLNSTLTSTACTSFVVHDSFLLISTHDHNVHCVPLSIPLSQIGLHHTKASPYDHSLRSIERGARLVVSVPFSTRVILQMPRGNLEAISPRALTLVIARRYLHSLDFKNAFLLLRKNRLNLNYLYDANALSFETHLEKVIEGLSDPNNINLFLSELSDEDTSSLMYTLSADSTQHPLSVASHPALNVNERMKPVSSRNGGSAVIPGKANRVCGLIIAYLKQKDCFYYLVSILTALARMTPPALEDCLALVREVRDSPSPASSPTRNQDASRSALKYLSVLVDVSKLYLAALGTYDFDLCVMVAQVGQLDPKEYLPFLDSLHAMEENFRKYSIDLHLKKYKHALLHLIKAGEKHFDLCMSLIRDQVLYRVALDAYHHGEDKLHYKIVSKAYGDHLSSLGKDKDASVAYFQAEEFRLSVEAAVKEGDFNMALGVAHKALFDEKQVFEIASKLVIVLKGKGSFSDAAFVEDVYCSNPEAAILILLDGYLWNEALRMAYRIRRIDLIETNIKPSLKEARQSLLDRISSSRTLFERYSLRLPVVRKIKAEMRATVLLQDGGEDGIQDGDLFSDTSSIASMTSTSSSSSQRSRLSYQSGRSSRSKRKSEKKKMNSLREGSRYEEEALVAAITKLIQEVNTMMDEISLTLQHLVLFSFFDEAKALQSAFDEYFKLVQEHIAVDDIWAPILPLFEEQTNPSSNNNPTSSLDSSSSSVSNVLNTLPLALDTAKVWKMDMLS